MDPQQRLLLESAHISLARGAKTHSLGAADSTTRPSASAPSNAAMTQTRARAGSIAAGNVGVFIGISYAEYGHILGVTTRVASTYTATGSSLSVAAGDGFTITHKFSVSFACDDWMPGFRTEIFSSVSKEWAALNFFLCLGLIDISAGRISYVFGLSGPCLAIDTACSSGLVAVGNAHNALMLGTTASAIAGGVNLMLSANTHAMYAVAGKLRPCILSSCRHVQLS